MNPAIVSAFWRQRLTSPMRVALAALFLGMGLFPVLFTGSIALLGKNSMNVLAFVFAAGLIGQEVSSGVLTLAFARPLRRWEYVLSRWAAAASLAIAFGVLQVVLGAAIAIARHGDVTATTVLAKSLEGVLAIVGVTSVLTLCSALAPGLGDLGLYLVGMITGSLVATIGSAKGWAWLMRTGQELQRFVDPALDPAPLFGAGTFSWFELVSYLSTIVLCLVLAIAVVNRKELSYAAG